MNQTGSGTRLLIWLLVVASCGALARAQGANGTTTEAPDESPSLKKLRTELLQNRLYDRLSRPVKNHLTQTKVDMRITVNEFVELDTVNSMLITDAWFHITWRDELLSWDPNDYQQLKQIHMNPNEIWKPDIVLINTADQDNLLNIFTDSDVVVNSTGDVLWITMGLLRSKCPVWAYDYPFTVRPVSCRLTFCSLIYQSHEVNITTPGNEFFLAGPWFVNPRLQFINVTGERYERFYDGYGTYSFESLTIMLKRRDNAMPMLMRIPTLASISLVLCMFFMPVTWSVRLHLALFAMLIQLLLILYIGLQMGPNAIGLVRPISYLRDDLLLSSLALLLTLVFRRLLVLADQLPQLPYFFSSLLAGPLARLLCFGINQSEYTQHQQASDDSNKWSSKSSLGTASILPTSLHQTAATRHTSQDRVALVNDDSDDLESGPQRGSQLGPSGEQPFESSSRRLTLTSSQYEWMQMIIFCDRLLFILYALAMVPRLI